MTYRNVNGTPDPSYLGGQDINKGVEPVFRLSEASLRINSTLEYDIVLQEVIDNARYLTDARYGALVLFDQSGSIESTVSSGMTSEQLAGMPSTPHGKGLLGYLNELDGPLRIADIAGHHRGIGLPEGHPPIRSLLGIQILHEGTHLGNIYLGDKEGLTEFSPLDERMLVRFAAHAGNAITNSRKFERERRIKTDLRALVKIAPVGLVVFDAKTGAVLTSNQECQRIGGKVGSEAMSWEEVQQNCTLTRADGREMTIGDRPIMQVMQSGEVVRAEEIVLNFSDGRTVNTLVNAAPIFSDRGEIVSIVIAIQDMTPLEDANGMRAEFLGLVSQELRTPLTTIKGSTVALAEIAKSLNSSESLQLSQIVDQQVEAMRSQINSLIDLSNIDAGTLALNVENCDFSTLVAEAVREFRRGHSGPSIHQQMPPDLPAVSVDKIRVTQMLRDLFAHAYKYSSETSTISVSARQIGSELEVSLSTDSNRPQSAPPPELIDRIRSTHRADINQRRGGDGLALAICEGIVMAHGGEFQADSGPNGHGMAFTFTIPLAGGSQDQSLRFWQDSDPTDHHIGPKPRIFVAADDPATMEAVCRGLSTEGYETFKFPGCEDFTRPELREQPYLVLWDLTTLGSEGLETIHRLSTEFQTQIIAVVEQGDSEMAARATEMGVDWCVMKPISLPELLSRIRTPLARTVKPKRKVPTDGFSVGSVVVDYSSHAVTVDDEPVQLTATEYKLLHELTSKAGRVLTQDELLHRVWGPEYSGESQLLRAYVKTLRQKLGDNARQPSYIYTEHGIGYRMAKA